MQIEYMDYIYPMNRFSVESFQNNKSGSTLIPDYLGQYQLDGTSGQV